MGSSSHCRIALPLTAEHLSRHHKAHPHLSPGPSPQSLSVLIHKKTKICYLHPFCIIFLIHTQRHVFDGQELTHRPHRPPFKSAKRQEMMTRIAHMSNQPTLGRPDSEPRHLLTLALLRTVVPLRLESRVENTLGFQSQTIPNLYLGLGLDAEWGWYAPLRSPFFLSIAMRLRRAGSCHIRSTRSFHSSHTYT